MATRSSMSIMADNGELTVDELAEFVSRLFTTVSGPETVTLRSLPPRRKPDAFTPSPSEQAKRSHGAGSMNEVGLHT